MPSAGSDGLIAWRPRCPPIGPVSFGDLLDSLLDVEPTRLALIDEHSQLTYPQLHDLVGKTASRLATEGVRAGDRIAASLRNESPIIVLFLAAMRLGAIWVGVNRALTLAEKRNILHDSQ